jgi:hypothetical protein
MALRVSLKGQTLSGSSKTSRQPDLSISAGYAGPHKLAGYCTSAHGRFCVPTLVAHFLMLRRRSDCSVANQRLPVSRVHCRLCRTLALARQIGKKRRLAELVVTGQKKGVIDGLQQDVQVL